MARGPLTFKQRDITRVLKAAVAAGHKVTRVEIAKDGNLFFVLNNEKPPTSPVDDWDKALSNDS
jgi:hypothetical protein